MFGIPWRLIGYAAAILAVLSTLWGYGHTRYNAGRAAEKAIWTPQLIEAQKAQAEAEARAKTIATASEANRADLENHIEQITRESNAALAGSGKRNAGLLRQLATAARRCDVPPVAGSAPANDGAAESEGRADKAGASLAGVTADCRHDADILGLWQEWYRRESALR